MSVPGLNGLDFPIEFSYKSGIQVNQPSSWIGLGWNFDAGNISRDVMSASMVGQGTNAPDIFHGADFANIPAIQPDRYYVTAPGVAFNMLRPYAVQANLPFALQETNSNNIDTNGFVITDWKPWKVEFETGIISAGRYATNKPDFIQNALIDVNSNYFAYSLSTIDTGTDCNLVKRTKSQKYGIPANPYTGASAIQAPDCQIKEDIKRFVLTSPDGVRYVFGLPLLMQQRTDSPLKYSGTNEIFVQNWRLTAVLGADYNESDGDLIPDSTASGAWIKFRYNVFTQSKTDDGQSVFREIAYLSTVETPTHIAEFNNPAETFVFSGWHKGLGNPCSQFVHCQEGYRKETDFSSKEYLLKQIVLKVKNNTSNVRLKRISFYHNETDYTYNTRYHLNEIKYYGLSDADILPGYLMSYYGGASIYSEPNQGVSYLGKSDGFGYLNRTAYLGAQLNNISTDLNDEIDAKAWSLKTILHPTGSKEEFIYENDSIDYTFHQNSPYLDITEVQHASANFSNQAFVQQETRKILNFNGVGNNKIGLRLKQVNQYLSKDHATIYNTEVFTYGTGKLNAIPTTVYEKLLKSAGGFFMLNRYERGSSDIYYSSVQKTNPDNTTIKTEYLNGEITSLQARVYRYIGSNFSASNPFVNTFVEFFTDNKGDLSWGEVDKITNCGTNGVCKEEKSIYNPILASLQNMGNSVLPLQTLQNSATQTLPLYVYWKYGNDLQKQETRYYSTLNSTQEVTQSTEYVYSNNLFNLPVEVIKKGSGIPTIVQKMQYGVDPAWQGATEFKARHLLNVVIRQDVSARQVSAGGLVWDKPLDVSINTWKNYVVESRTLFKPFQSFQWRGEVNSVPATPLLSSIANQPNWLLTASQESYDVHGRLLQVKDTYGNATNLTFGSNQNRCTAAPQTIRQRALLNYTCIERGGLKTELAYDEYANLTKVWGVNGKQQSEFVYDGLDRLKETRVNYGYGWLGTLKSYQYFLNREVQGKLLEEYPNFVRTSMPYLDRVSTDYFDGLGRLVQSQSRLNVLNDSTLVKSFVYDTMDRLYKESKPFITNAPQTTYKMFTQNGYQVALQGAFITGDVIAKANTYYNGVNSSTERKANASSYAYTEVEYDTFYQKPNKTYSLGLESGSRVSQSINYKIGTPPAVLGYNFNTFITETIDADGNIVRAYANVAGRKLATEAFADKNNANSVIYAKFEYDDEGKLTKVYPPNYFAPPVGSYPNNWTTTYTYNTLAQLVEKTTPDAGTVHYKYDKLGNIRFSQDAKQAENNRYSYTEYDAFNRPQYSGERNLLSGQTFSALDADTPFIAASTVPTDALGVSFYDQRPATLPINTGAWTRIPTNLQNTKGETVIAAYKIGKNRYNQVPLWQIEAFSYDEAGKVTEKRILTDTDSSTIPDIKLFYTYNILGEVTQVLKVVGADSLFQRMHYDKLGRATRLFVHHKTLDDKLVEIETCDPDCWIEESYYIQNPKYLKLATEFTAGGQVSLQRFTKVSATNAEPVYEMWNTYNARELLTDINKVDQWEPWLAKKFAANYKYSKNGTIIQAEYFNPVTNNMNAFQHRYKQTYQYDGLNRLLNTHYFAYADWRSDQGYGHGYAPSNAFKETLSYDANGNIKTLYRTNESGNVIDNLTYFYQDQQGKTSNLLAMVSDAVAAATNWDMKPTKFGYDANGNMTAELDANISVPVYLSQLQYDVRNLPTQVQKNGQTAFYRYNAAGQRIYKRIEQNGSVLTEEHYLMNGSEMVAFYKDNQLKYWETAYGRYERDIASPNGFTSYYYLRDHLGTTRVVLNESGQRVEAQDYYAFGLKMPTRAFVSANPTRNGFTTKQRDVETGWDYFGARYYNPALGRWMAVDPIYDELDWEELDDYGLQSINPYNYVYNSPVIRVDPDGKLSRLCPPFCVTPLFSSSAVAPRYAPTLRPTNTLPLPRTANASTPRPAPPTTSNNTSQGQTRNQNNRESSNPHNSQNRQRPRGDGIRFEQIDGSLERVARSSRAARRDATRTENIPLSRGPQSQNRNQSGRELIYETRGAGGRQQRHSVQEQRMDRSHERPHWEAGRSKGRQNDYGRDKLENGKSKTYFD